MKTIMCAERRPHGLGRGQRYSSVFTKGSRALLCTIACISLIVIALMFTGQSDAKIDPKTVVGLWLLDDGSGKVAKDSSGKGNDGTLEGNPKWVDGKFGKALQFTGETDYVEVPGSDSLKINEQITLVAWGYLEAMEGGGDQYIDRGAHSSKPNCYGLYYHGGRTGVEFMLGDGAARHDARATQLPATKQWQHVAGTYDGESQKLYYDGEIAAENKEKFPFRGDNDLPVIIGRGVERPQYAFNGTIDEVAVFNVPLTADDIKVIMTRGLSEALGMTAVSSEGKLATTWGAIKSW